MERARRELSIDMAVGVLTLKLNKNMTWSRFTFTQKWI